MGRQISHLQYPPDRDLQPGTYRIFNAIVGTAIQVSDHDSAKVVAWDSHNGENQQWILQRSGDGYQLQNVLYSGYLAVGKAENQVLVYASRYPTTWVFLKLDEHYIIKFADSNQVLDLHNGWAHNGNEMNVRNLDGKNMAHRTWRLERLGQFQPMHKEQASTATLGRDSVGTKGQEASHSTMIMGIIVAFVLSLLCYHFYCPRQVADRVLHLYWFCRRALYVAGKNIASKIWRLELLGNGAVSELREETTNESTELLQLQGELSIANQELSELHSLLYERDKTIQQLEQDLKSKED